MDARETHGEYNYQPNRAQTTIAENPAYDYSPIDGERTQPAEAHPHQG